MCSASTLLLFFLLCFFDPTTVFAQQNLTFEFPSFTSLRNITLIGDSFLRNGVVGLTRSSDVPTSSAGAVIYDNPICLFDPQSNTSSSFSTSFAFSVTNNLNNPPSLVDGSLSFFLFPANHTLGSSGGYSGLLCSSQLTCSDFVAVEFNPSDNGVELDLNGVALINATGDTISQGIDLKSGELITAWIDYDSEKRKLLLFLSSNSSSNLKPENPILNVDDLDLSRYINETAYVGFSASTEGSTELHQLVSWRFQSNGSIPATSPKFHSRNVSDSFVSATEDIHKKSSNNSSSKHDKRLGLGVAIAGPAFFCVVLLSLGCISVRKWRNSSTPKRVKTELMACPKEFSYKELKVATKGFHSSRIIGQGSFGTVYKALFLPSGTIAAVKRSRHSHDSKTEFLAELSIIAGLRHKNLVQLQGWCVDKGELLLVYDFMPNGSLDKMLYQESEECQKNLLNWSRRLNIAIGLASVLTYLHQECEKRVIHRDIKTGNILLDANYNPRLGDFGLAKLMDHDGSPVSTLTAGTMGYLAPEYLQYGMATEKTDAFSYGVVVLEVACGRRPIEREGQNMVNLVDWVWGLHSQGKILEAADKRLNGEFTEEEMKKLLLLGLSCANPDSAERPTMTRVLQILSNHEAASTLLVPKVKPCLTFSCSLPLSLDEIVSESDEESSTDKSLCEIRID